MPRTLKADRSHCARRGDPARVHCGDRGADADQSGSAARQRLCRQRRLDRDPKQRLWRRLDDRVPPDLADFLIAKNVTSVGPHSTVGANLADMEHNLPHDQAGPTNPINMTPVERRWHRTKTYGGWTYVNNDDDSITWTSPHGLSCRVEPHDYRLGP